MTTMVLELDDADYATIQAEITRRQIRSRWPGGGAIIPEGDSCLAGALIAEMARDLEEYRALQSVPRLVSSTSKPVYGTVWRWLLRRPKYYQVEYQFEA